MEKQIRPASGKPLRKILPRIIGIVLLGVLIAKFEFGQIINTIMEADPALIVGTVVLIIPMIVLKAYRWQGILKSQSISFGLWPASLAYFGSMFFGFLTPGRLREFSRVFSLTARYEVSSGLALSSVLVDRLFDFYLTLSVGAVALAALAPGSIQIIVSILLLITLILPIFLLGNQALFDRVARFGKRFGNLGEKLFAEKGWINELSVGIRQLSFRRLLISSVVTFLAYSIYYFQCFALARALHIQVGFAPVMFAVSLGGLVTLIPISISGLGTREAALIAYLGQFMVSPGEAMSLSLLVFAVFYLGGGFLGMVAWMIDTIQFGRQVERL